MLSESGCKVEQSKSSEQWMGKDVMTYWKWLWLINTYQHYLTWLHIGTYAPRNDKWEPYTYIKTIIIRQICINFCSIYVVASRHLQENKIIFLSRLSTYLTKQSQLQFQICLRNFTHSCKGLVDGSKTYVAEQNILDWLTYLLSYLLTYSMVLSPSWEANWFAASQEIPRILRNPKVHYRTHKRPPPVSILGPTNPVHIPTSYLLEIHPNIIHPSMPRPPQWSPSLRLPHQDPKSAGVFARLTQFISNRACTDSNTSVVYELKAKPIDSCNLP